MKVWESTVHRKIQQNRGGSMTFSENVTEKKKEQQSLVQFLCSEEVNNAYAKGAE